MGCEVRGGYILDEIHLLRVQPAGDLHFDSVRGVLVVCWRPECGIHLSEREVARRHLPGCERFQSGHPYAHERGSGLSRAPEHFGRPTSGLARRSVG